MSAQPEQSPKPPRQTSPEKAAGKARKAQKEQRRSEAASRERQLQEVLGALSRTAVAQELANALLGSRDGIRAHPFVARLQELGAIRSAWEAMPQKHPNMLRFYGRASAISQWISVSLLAQA